MALEWQGKQNLEAGYDIQIGNGVYNTIDNFEETAPEEERIAFYKHIREAEYNKLKSAMVRETAKMIELEKDDDEVFQQNIKGFIRWIIDEACRDTDMQDFDKKENLTTELSDNKNVEAKYDDLSGTTDKEHGETVSEEERVAYFTQVRKSEYSKLVEAMEQERIRKEKRLAKEKQREELVKQFEDFFNVNDAGDTLQPKPKKEEIRVDVPQTIFHQQPSKSEDDSHYILHAHMTIEPDQIPFIADAVQREKHDISWQYGPFDDISFRSEPDENELSTTPLTSDSEWLSIDLDDVEESPRPRLKPFFSEAEALPYLQPRIPNIPIPIQHMVPQSAVLSPLTLEPKRKESRNFFRHLRHWLRKNVLCCCGKGIDNEN